ncbi:MAG: hypothetical protein A2096_11755 [Spirochaetes bacterium GWF1_41_5]|nr:MAG: hypothetical protein A2096_11755 [Spirochaetes bacterium GWF1_41_5]HBE01752.1 hypothetical protein [Spirochaetia bacterium]
MKNIEPPRIIDLQLTYRCNLRCKICAQWGDEGAFKHLTADIINKNELHTDDWIFIIKQAAVFKPLIKIWGGEPLLHEGFREISEAISRFGLKAEIVTNGYFLGKYTDELMRGHFQTIHVSLDGDEKKHDEIRGTGGLYARIKTGAAKLSEFKKSDGALRVNLLCVIQKNNQDILDKILEAAAELKADSIVFAPLMFMENRRLCEQKLFTEKYLHFKWESDSSWDVIKYGAEPDKTAAFIKKLPLVYKGVHAQTNLPKNADLKSWQYETDTVFGYSSCRVPWYKMNIMPDGECNFCMDFPGYNLGNIKTDTLLDIWNGEKAGKYRQVIETHRLTPVCRRCIWLYNKSPET